MKKRINALNKPEMLIIDIEGDGLPPMPPLEDDEEVKLKPEQTIAKELKKIIKNGIRQILYITKSPKKLITI